MPIEKTHTIACAIITNKNLKRYKRPHFQVVITNVLSRVTLSFLIPSKEASLNSLDEENPPTPKATMSEKTLASIDYATKMEGQWAFLDFPYCFILK
jgi:hypothetical protein